MKRLLEIFDKIKILEIQGDKNVNISGLSIDSRTVKNNELYVAVKGYKTDGHQYIDQAIRNGASAILCENFPENINNETVYLQIDNTRLTLGPLASNFYGDPSSKLKLVGITGTNGKTTIATTLYNLTEELGFNSGLISTVRNVIHNETLQASHTTPDPIQINKMMSEMLNTGCEYCFLEVSSHALDQMRISGLDFNVGIFSNITQDHLDYHKSFKEYLRVKKSFFDELSETAFALSNSDDKNSSIILQNTKAIKKTYSIKSLSDFKTRIVESNFDSMLLEFDGTSMWTPFIGEFNASNLCAVYACAILLGFEKEEILPALSGLFPVKGRCEYIKLSDNKTGIVDYAHTPDALKNVLETINQIKKGNEIIITVVGAGGDRDRSKRPKMAGIAASLSDKLILTSDNPRTENPEDIIDEMYSGVGIKEKNKVIRITNRKEAIKTAVNMAQSGDIILVAGKGHENYQDINGIKTHFDDMEILSEVGLVNNY